MVLTVTLQARHASAPICRVNVFIDRRTPGRRRSERVSYRDHYLVVPPPATWTLDTVRAALEALRRFLPAHDINDVRARVELYGAQSRRHAVLAARYADLEVIAYVPALNAGRKTDSAAFQFTQPMLAELRALQERGAFVLGALQPVDATIAPQTDDEPLGEGPSEDSQLREDQIAAMNQIAAMFAELPSNKRDAINTLIRAALEHVEDEDEDEGTE